MKVDRILLKAAYHSTWSKQHICWPLVISDHQYMLHCMSYTRNGMHPSSIGFKANYKLDHTPANGLCGVTAGLGARAGSVVPGQTRTGPGENTRRLEPCWPWPVSWRGRTEASPAGPPPPLTPRTGSPSETACSPKVRTDGHAQTHALTHSRTPKLLCFMNCLIEV